ncbi:Pfs NACHT and Ankyrin domain [Fusarium albosuccineum]|uniref:Pfs NACHT and Ankyrin domain n=1 Tax=Fusarium albosuccineum TaxID=1237068 RepID=A0A8H4L102_9HYPO|nr:Pfs NACHT and Ankyrin domain [Fusarium albosuccineum]
MEGKRRWAKDGAAANSHRPPKQQKSFRNHTRNARSHDRYTVAWVCALHIEMAAARAMLDELHGDPPKRAKDPNSYTLGRIQQHNVVIACLPNAQYGLNNAAIVVTNLTRTFPSIKLGLMVGIGGGAPNKVDLRLGDIVVGSRVMQYDLGKAMPHGTVHRTATARVVPHSISTVVSNLRSKHEWSPSRVPSILEEMMGGLPDYGRPSSPDRLFSATYQHDSPTPDCTNCDLSKLVPRRTRASVDPVIHHGAIGSANQVIKDSEARDNLARELDIICFEMETAGLMDRYAAATAAAFAKEFLEEFAAGRELQTTEYEHDPPHQAVSPNRRILLLESLKFDQMDARKTNIKSAHSKTCHWFLELPEYQAWLDAQNQAEDHGFLWIKGKPGAGKSTIMKFIYLKTKRKRPRQPTITASFFFNARGTEPEKSVSGMYRSLILQLLEGFPDLQEVLDDTDLVPRCQSDCPPLNVLKDIFFNAVSELGSRSFTCFVDALDECDEQQVMDMVQYFEELAEQCSDNGVRFQICFSSRHYPYIHIRRGIQLTLEDQRGHAEDLGKYVQSNLQIRDQTILSELRPQLLKKAAGVFLWMVLVVDILNKENRRGRLGLRKRLAEVPTGLTELFKDILKRDCENMEDLLLCVLWVLCAKEPLSPEEYYHALWSGLALKNLADPEIPNITASDASDCVGGYVITSLKGLAEVTKTKNPTVQFIHESVRDFLIKDGGLHELWPELGFDWESLSHERLKQCCSSYMNHPSIRSSVDKPAQAKSILRDEVAGSYPFLEYANQQVFYHANLAAAAVPQYGFLSQFPLRKWILISNIFERFKVRHYHPACHLQYVLADRGFSALIRTILKQKSDFDIPGGRYGYPLFAALANAHKDAVAALLGLASNICDGVDICEGLQTSRDPSGFKGRTPLTWAASNGRVRIVKYLILRGDSIEETDKEGRSPLTAASQHGKEAVARFLIEKGADIEGGKDGCQTPLSEASNKAVATLLIGNGADIMAAYAKGGDRFILNISRFGLEDEMKYLIDKGANVNARDDVGSTLLHKAFDDGKESLMRHLIENGADINCQNTGGNTPLHHASVSGKEFNARILLENGADAILRCNEGNTPLHDATTYGRESVMRLLINNGADISIRNNEGTLPRDMLPGWARVGLRDLLCREEEDQRSP